MKNKVITFESRFEKPKKFNSQFHMVKIYIAYAGKNRNGSIISKETFEKLIPSLYGVPVVGEWKNEDFGGHGGKIEISEDGVEYIDTTKPYGFIDSSATVQWENVVEEDGVEREYLTTTAFLWTGRYPETLKILENKNNQSMELNVFDGNMSEEYPDYFEILDGEFSALCILGEDVEPCFESAKISQFNLDKDTFKSEFMQMVAELKESVNSKDSDEDVETGGGEDVNKTESMFATYNQKRDALKNALDPVIVRDENDRIIKETYYWLSDFDDEYVYVERSHWEDNNYEVDHGRFAYDFSEEKMEATIKGEFEKMILVWLTEEENKKLKEDRNSHEATLKEYEELKTRHENLKSDHNKLKEENDVLKEFKAQKDKEEFEAEQQRLREEKIEHINTEYSSVSQEIRDLFISKVDEYESVEDIDADLCVYIVKNKVVFSKTKPETDIIKVSLQDDNDEFKVSPYGNLFN